MGRVGVFVAGAAAVGMVVGAHSKSVALEPPYIGGDSMREEDGEVFTFWDEPQTTQDFLEGGSATRTFVSLSQEDDPDECVFNSGSEASWIIDPRGRNPPNFDVDGCQPFALDSSARDSLPRGLDADSNADVEKAMGAWCFSGSRTNGEAIYKASNAGQDEWSYCRESTPKRFMVSTSFSKNPLFQGVGVACRNQWNFNNRSGPGTPGILAGVVSSCLPFVDFKPNTEGLDLSDIPDLNEQFWCFIDTGDEDKGYNPTQTEDGQPTDKTYDWGFCSDALFVETEAPVSEAPTRSPTPEPTTASPTDQGETPAPVADKETTDAPTQGTETGDTPSSAIRLSTSLLAICTIVFQYQMQ